MAHGGVTLSEAHGALDRPIGYTTMQTRLNRLVEKGVVSRTADRPARYAAAVAPEDVRPSISICCWSVSATAAWFP